MFNTRAFAIFLENALRFAVRRTGQSLLIVHDFAAFRACCTEIPASVCPEQDGDFFCYDPTQVSGMKVLRPAPATFSGFHIWERCCQAHAISSLQLANTLRKEERGVSYYQFMDKNGAIHLLHKHLMGALASSVHQLQKNYQFEALPGHCTRVFSRTDLSLPIAMMMECVEADPLGLDTLMRQAMAAAVRLRAEESLRNETYEKRFGEEEDAG